MQQTPPQQQGPPGGHQQSPITPDQINLVQGLVEKCIQHYMTRTETIQTLQIQAQIDPRLTDSVWRRLELENQEFFDYYRVRLRIKEQIKVFNSLVQMQAQTVRNMPPPPRPLRPSDFGDISAFPELTKVIEPPVSIKMMPIKQQPAQYGEAPPMHPNQQHQHYQQNPYHSSSQSSQYQSPYPQGNPNAGPQQSQMMHQAPPRPPPGPPQHMNSGMQPYPNPAPNHNYQPQQGPQGPGPRSDAHPMQNAPQMMSSAYSKPLQYHHSSGHPQQPQQQQQQQSPPPHMHQQQQQQQQQAHQQPPHYSYGPPPNQGHTQSGQWGQNYNRGPPHQASQNGQPAPPRGPQSMMHQFVMSPDGQHGQGH